MEEEYITDQTIPEEVDVASPDGQAADSNLSQEMPQDAITLEEIEQVLGKKFPNKETALKSWKDTYSYVGKKSEPAPAPVQQSADNFVSKEQYEEDMWFAAHPDVADQKTLVRALKKETGKTLDEVLELPELKPLLEAKKAQAENSKSVIHGNSRIANTADYQTDLEQAIQTGNLADFMAKHKGVAIPE